MKAKLLTLSSAAVMALGLATGTAAADGWPASVAGTWSVQGNQSAGALVITQFAGAAGSQCKPIRGTIYGADAIEGFYCPGSGRIAFLRKVGTAATAQTRQFWSGNLSQVANTLHIGGTFYAAPHNNVSGTTGGSLGEYNFSARK
jgi:hypothetical protein